MRASVDGLRGESALDNWTDGAFALGGATVGGIALWLAQRLVGKAAWQNVINNGFRDLIAAHREEMAGLRKELAGERAARAASEARMRGEIANLTQANESLRRELQRRGVDLPSPPYLATAEAHEAIIELPPSEGE